LREIIIVYDFQTPTTSGRLESSHGTFYLMNRGRKMKRSLGVYQPDWLQFTPRSSLIDLSDCDVSQLIRLLQITWILTGKLATHALP